MRRLRNYPKMFILSLLLHMTLAFLTWVSPTPPSPNSTAIEIQYVPRSSKQETEKMDQVEVVKEKELQMVDQDKTALNDEIDPNAKYLSAHNQKVQKQTVSQNRKSFSNHSSGTSAAAAKATAQVQLFPQLDVQKELLRWQKESLHHFDDGMSVEHTESAKKMEAVAAIQGTPGPQQETPGTLDYLKDVDPGLETFLSTKEFKFYGYFQRIREQIHQYWTPKVTEKISRIYSQGRTIASTDDKITKLLITLDKKGYVMKIQVLGQSGLRDLDEAAIEAFKSAAPFPNPPTGIVDPDGTIKILWNFVIEV